MNSLSMIRSKLRASGFREALAQALAPTAAFAAGVVATVWLIDGTAPLRTGVTWLAVAVIPVCLVLRTRGATRSQDTAARTLARGTTPATTIQRYRLLVENATVCIKELDHDGRILSMNPAGLSMMQLEDEAEICGRELFALIDEDDRDRVREAHRLALAGVVSDVTFGAHVKGQPRWFDSSYVPVRDSSGEVLIVMSISTDVTRFHRAEERKRALTRELDHRVKNTLAMVVALADQSMRGSDSLTQFREKFNGRIQALARNHENLSASHWRGLGTLEILQSTFALFDSSRVQIESSVALLPARTTGPLTLALNELATNAAKYGAFSAARGSVLVRAHARGREVHVTWEESVPGGISAPKCLGVGLNLVRGLIQHELGGDVQFDFAPSGMVCHIRFPLDPGDSPLVPEDAPPASELQPA